MNNNTLNTSPRSRLLHVLQYLRRGDQISIAERVKCHPATVSAVLNGRQSQTSPLAMDILVTAREFAMKNNPYKYRNRYNG